ncbi:MAG TPA: undecaprenyl-diphosphate phosphatase [Bacteroidales bacterium]|nr:undecaprenyl-diphosphate phosphatase [Bacteroidales bacterium]
MTFPEAVIIAIVEGITEFLPISSTGHMIITEKLLGVESTAFTKAFIVNIQFGAILSVLILYWKRFFQSLKFYYKLFIAFIPAAVIGFIFGDFIDSLLENVLVVAISLFLGGIILLFVDKWFNKPRDDQNITYPTALKIGLFQCIAMIPGISRSAATIIGGMSQKLTRKNAAEFSFFLAVPTMLAATGYKLLSNYKDLFFNADQSVNTQNISLLLVGNLVAFLVAMAAIKFLITFLTKHGFKLFGYYRIVIGLLLIVLLIAGVDLKIL